jgi:hypothetical protein
MQALIKELNKPNFTMCHNPFNMLDLGEYIPCCEVCEKPKAKYRCSMCHKSYYCGVECQTKAWTDHKKRLCYPIDKALFENKNNTALRECHEANLFQEFKGLTYILDGANIEKNLFGKGRWYIFKAVISLVMLHPDTGTFNELSTKDHKEKAIYKQYKEDMIEGAKLIHLDGVDSITDPLIWSFIADSMHRNLALFLMKKGYLKKSARRDTVSFM